MNNLLCASIFSVKFSCVPQKSLLLSYLRSSPRDGFSFFKAAGNVNEPLVGRAAEKEGGVPLGCEEGSVNEHVDLLQKNTLGRHAQ